VITHEWQAAILNQDCISLLVIDIDNFIAITTIVTGHATGDKVLQQVAAV